MKKFLKNMVLSMAVCLSVGCFSAHATKNNTVRQSAIDTYQSIEKALEHNGCLLWNGTEYEVLNDYVYTTDIPEYLDDIECVIYKNYVSGSDIAVLEISRFFDNEEYYFNVCGLSDYIIRGSRYARTMVRWFLDAPKVCDFKDNAILVINEELEELVKSKDPNWNPEKIILSDKSF